jgi:hypothetical protein
MAMALKIGKWLFIADFTAGMMINVGIAMGWINPVTVILKIASLY